MERFFMRRASAVILLLGRRRMWLKQIAATPSGNVEPEMREIESIDRLILDVRAGRVQTFELADPNTMTIHVTD